MNVDGNAEEDHVDPDEWVEIGSCKANDGPVWKACWGPREYGTSLLASIAGSVVNIWGERDTCREEHPLNDLLVETQIQHGEVQKLALNNRATLVEARGSMRDVAFAPSEFGLKLVGTAFHGQLQSD